MRRRRYDPLAALTPQQQQKLARTSVRSQIMPLIAQLNKEFAGRAASGQQAIGGYTNELARSLGGAQEATHNIYAGAEKQQTAIDSALANRIAAAGGSIGSEVAGKIAGTGLDPAANTLAQQGAGAAAASAGVGSARLSSLLASGAAAENYSGQLPGIAKLGGLQRAQQYAAQLESERATQTGDLRSKIPGLTQSILGDIRNQEFQKAAARLSYGGDMAQLAETQRSHDLTYNARMSAIAAANARSGMTLRERARHNGVSEKEQTRRDQEHERHNRQAEAQQNRNERERKRHNRQSEKNQRKKKGGGGPPSMNR